MSTGIIHLSLKKNNQSKRKQIIQTIVQLLRRSNIYLREHKGARSRLVSQRGPAMTEVVINSYERKQGGFSSCFTSNLLRQKNLVGCTAQPGTDKAVRRNSFERQLSRRLTVLCTRNFEGLRESYGPIPSV